jgi:glutamate synthase domain-containing protein 2/glutamate synthase domain-containing protein 1/glutamate synthase domain-containing protein 3
MTTPELRPIAAPLYDPSQEHDACGVGFLADLDGRHASRLVPMALEALAALEHRGARAADDRTGDGAGLLLPLAPSLLGRIGGELTGARGRARPLGRVAVGMCFLPTDPPAVAAAQRLVEDRLAASGLSVLGWRNVPVDESLVAERAADEAPAIRQVVVGGPRGLARVSWARRLAHARRSIELAANREPGLAQMAIASLSTETIVYKGLFVGDELGRFYRDLSDPSLRMRHVVFHQRYSTNTFPSWRLAQPFRHLAHNGEINTVRANRTAMHGRRHDLGGGAWARRMAADGPLLSAGGSDSLSLDEALELLLLAGRRIDEALVSLVPPAAGLQGGDELEPATASEAWDGPAALVFADGAVAGCLQDRNGLRPASAMVTNDGLVVVSSEAGSIAIDPRRIASLHRLGPGELIVADARAGRLTGPMQPGTGNGRLPRNEPRRLARPSTLASQLPSDDRLRMTMGLDAEILRQVIRPIAIEGREAMWSMGDDTPIAPLARRPRRLSGFLRQSFAQVTNPAIDSERERVVMSLAMHVGRQPRLLVSHPEEGRTIRLATPVVDAATWAQLTEARPGWRVVQMDATWSVARGPGGLARALHRLARQARSAVGRGATLLAISDHCAGATRAAIPPLLAVGRVHQALSDAGQRSRCDVVVEAGECFDVHDLAMLVAAGASAVHPWLLLELADEVSGSRGAEDLDTQDARRHVADALEHGLRKVLARMGISTLGSYRGGQLFDVIGFERDLVTTCFPAAGGWAGRIGFAEIGSATLVRHRAAFRATAASLEDPGFVRFRASGEAHAFAPRVVKAVQRVAGEGPRTSRASDALALYRDTIAGGSPRQPRELLAVQPAGEVVPVERVEPARRIVRRFVSAAMSLGALSPEAHQALAIGMARLGASSNSGEGGEDPAWYHPHPDGDRRDAAIKQVASARFGVTTEYLARAEQLEIKIAQGSKPGEGGQLPGRKATAFIAALRRGQPGMTMISPPPHHDIYSIEDLAQLITDLRAVNPRARIGVKLVAGAGIGTIAAGVAKAHADYILISGHAGGTGASPLSSIKHVGLPWELGLAEVHQVLVHNRLRDRVALRVDGGLQTGRDVVVAALLGAEEFGFGTSALVALGCDMARQCHLDTCPTGIATQRDDLRAKFTGRPEDVVAFFTAIAHDVRRELASLGLRRLADAIGRADLLEASEADGAASPALDLTSLIRAPAWKPPRERRGPPKDAPLVEGRPVASSLEAAIVDEALATLDAGRPYRLVAELTTRQRTVGARLAGALAHRPEPRTLSHVTYDLTGAAGQSLGAFAVAGMRIVVSGVANDYVAKGLSGGTVVVRPAPEAVAEEPALVGNTCLYGATAGRLHVVGRAGMRFAVRNSGARAVVEGLGPHGCEYMTGGTVVVLGSIGANFGAGMTGGRAFVWDPPGRAEAALNDESVVASAVAADDEPTLLELLRLHAEEGSRRARSLLEAWPASRAAFRAVTPRVESLTLAINEVDPAPARLEAGLAGR